MNSNSLGTRKAKYQVTILKMTMASVKNRNHCLKSIPKYLIILNITHVNEGIFITSNIIISN